MLRQLLLILSIVLLAFSSEGQPLTGHSEKASRADELRGGQRKERWCYDVHYYNLDLKVDIDNRSISGSNEIYFHAMEDFETLQIDLFANMEIQRIRWRNRELEYTREYDAVFVKFPEKIKKGASEMIKVEYAGKPRVAKQPPWDGGFAWSKDKNGKPWVGVACQGIGASLWWPNKDVLADEPDSVRIHCTVPDTLRCVVNGTEEPSVKNTDGTITYNWKVSYPINNYNVSINIADYAHIHDVYTAADGDKLDLDYYVLSYNKEKAEKQFRQVKPMMACYEKYFGKYPFWKDGYALVETPYLGMEHQSAVAYGNNYMSGYAGMDRSGMKLDFDYILIHESGHEWWGNSVSSQDLADMWIHESFCTYGESVYIECLYGYDTAMTYVNALKSTVRNDNPMMGTYGLNKEGDADMYVKGMLFLNTLRHVVNDDELWWRTIKNMSDTTFKIRNTNYKEVVQFMNEKTGMNLTPLFEQYVTKSAIPKLEYKLKMKKKKLKLRYRWQVDVKDFRMPVVFYCYGFPQRTQVGTKWVKYVVKSNMGICNPTFDTTHFYYETILKK